MSGYIQTMKELEAATYGIRGGTGNSVLKAAGIVGGIHTAHDAGTSVMSSGIASGTTSLYSTLFGQKVWSMLNQEVNALAMLAKRPYTSSGWRVMTNRAAGGSKNYFDVGSGAEGSDTPRADVLGGVQENHELGSAGLQALAPSYDTLFTSPKTVAHMFDFSELAIEMAKIDDGVGDLRALIREDMGKHHAEVQNMMLLMPLQKYGEATTEANIGRNYTSLMKIVSSSEELQHMSDAGLFTSGTNEAGDATLDSRVVDLFGKSDRQLSSGAAQASYLDAQVDMGTNYLIGNARVLTLTILNDMITKLRQAGGAPKVILTGYDTIQHIGDLLQSQERFMERKEIVPTHNGVRGVKGREVGFRVATYFDIPLIPCKDMPKTGLGANKLSDLLLLDTDHLWLSVMKPTQYFEDGIDNGNPFGVGVLGNRGMYRTIAETGCSFFKGQGKITNITSA